MFSAKYGWWNEQLTSDRSFVTALIAGRLASCIADPPYSVLIDCPLRG